MRLSPTAENCDAAHSDLNLFERLAMPIRFSTVAANADILGDDAEITDGLEGPPQAGDTTTRDSAEHGDGRKPRADAQRGEAKPGKDINAAGLLKDKDAGKP